MSTFVVSHPDRLDSFLATEKAFLSRAKVQKAIEDGLVSVNESVCRKPAERVQEGDLVAVQETDRVVESPVVSTDLRLEVLYEDDACLVLNKPAGYAVHPGAAMDPREVTILHGIAFLFAQRSLPFSASTVLVHRLDKETTGCLLVAKTPEAQLRLQSQFETRTVEKIYLALVAGVPVHQTATVDSPIGRSPTDRTKMSIRGVGTVREAQTTYRVLDAHGHVALLECHLHTGRTHQIRVHLQSIGHAILGDSTYSSPQAERLNDELAVQNLCLHSWKLTFDSPADFKRHTVEVAVPAVMKEAMERAGVRIKN